MLPVYSEGKGRDGVYQAMVCLLNMLCGQTRASQYLKNVPYEGDY